VKAWEKAPGALLTALRASEAAVTKAMAREKAPAVLRDIELKMVLEAISENR